MLPGGHDTWHLASSVISASLRVQSRRREAEHFFIHVGFESDALDVLEVFVLIFMNYAVGLLFIQNSRVQVREGELHSIETEIYRTPKLSSRFQNHSHPPKSSFPNLPASTGPTEDLQPSTAMTSISHVSFRLLQRLELKNRQRAKRPGGKTIETRAVEVRN